MVGKKPNYERALLAIGVSTIIHRERGRKSLKLNAKPLLHLTPYPSA